MMSRCVNIMSAVDVLQAIDIFRGPLAAKGYRISHRYG